MSSRILKCVFDAPPSRAEKFEDVCLADIALVDPTPTRSLLSQVLQKFRSDEEIVGELQNGNTDALTFLFKRHSSLVFKIARRILRNDAEAEDAVQQIFLDVFRSIHQFSAEKGTFKAWLLMFAYHRTFNCRRALSASHFFETDPLEEILPELLRQAQGHSGYTPCETSILVGQALSNLQPRQRRTIELIYYEGLTAEEVAIRTGETVRVVRHNLYRGLEKLRRILCDTTPSNRDLAKRGIRS